jgi:5-methylcytosine-specific restriction endonuclease McrA
MRNLIPYNKDCFGFHKSVVDSKHACESKERLIILNPEIEKVYKTFEKQFSDKCLNTLVPNSYFTPYRDDLYTLYKFQSAVIKKLRDEIRQLQVRTIINTCQNCTIDSVNSLDHILPKGKFPEFVVNPKNLFPCCSTCNSYKNDSIENKDNVGFLNLYLDELPQTQYLFVDILLDKDNEIDFRFYI